MHFSLGKYILRQENAFSKFDFFLSAILEGSFSGVSKHMFVDKLKKSFFRSARKLNPKFIRNFHTNILTKNVWEVRSMQILQMISENCSNIRLTKNRARYNRERALRSFFKVRELGGGPEWLRQGVCRSGFYFLLATAHAVLFSLKSFTNLL